MNYKKIIAFWFLIFVYLNSNGQNIYNLKKELFPYNSFDSIVFYTRDHDLIKDKKATEIRAAFHPYRLVDKSLKKISTYYKYKRTLNDKQTKFIIKIINKKQRSIYRDCATIYSDYGFVFYKNKKIIGFFEVSLDCYELLFVPENINFKQAFKHRQEKKFMGFLTDLENE